MNDNRIIILSAKTGGGHWSSAIAIKNALENRNPDGLQIDIVDGLNNGGRELFSFSKSYALLSSYFPQAWKIIFQATNNKFLSKYFGYLLYLMIRRKLDLELHRYGDPSMVVSTNAALLEPAGKLIRNRKEDTLPLISVVTDPFNVHALWFNEKVDYVITPTNLATSRMIELGVDRSKILEFGIPINEKFSDNYSFENKNLRHLDIGLNPEFKTILIIGGADGHKRIKRITNKIIQVFDSRLQLIIVCGRNEKLFNDLTQLHSDHERVKVLGFVNNMHELMLLSHVVLTKAGALTTFEALAAGTPIIFFSRIPGQEEGIPEWVFDNKAGFIAYNISELINCLNQLLEDDELRLRMSTNAKRISNSNGAVLTADFILDLINSGP